MKNDYIVEVLNIKEVHNTSYMRSLSNYQYNEDNKCIELLDKILNINKHKMMTLVTIMMII